MKVDKDKTSLDNYFGIFSCYSPGRGCVPTLIMSGLFGVDDLHRVSIEVDRYIQDQGKMNYYGWRHG